MGDALYEAWINILLSSGITHVKNITGNILTTLAHVGESYVAGGIGTVKRAMGGEGGAYIGEGNAQLFAGLMVLREAFSAAGSSFKYGQSPIEGSKLQGSGTKRFGNDFCSWLSLLICSIKRSVPDPKRTKSKCSVFRLIS